MKTTSTNLKNFYLVIRTNEKHRYAFAIFINSLIKFAETANLSPTQYQISITRKIWSCLYQITQRRRTKTIYRKFRRNLKKPTAIMDIATCRMGYCSLRPMRSLKVCNNKLRLCTYSKINKSKCIIIYCTKTIRRFLNFYTVKVLRDK